MIKLLLAAAIAIALAPSSDDGGVRIHPENPRYLTYGGKPFYVIGSGMESQCEPWSRTISEWRAYLDMLHRNGFNRVRFFPWSFCWSEDLLPTFSPWALLNAKEFEYDLTRFNSEYWDFVKEILSMARERDIVVEYVLFDYCSLADGAGELCWTRHPFSALHNNGGALPGGKGKPDIYAFFDYSNLDLFVEPLRPKWPWQQRNQWYQQAYVKHTVDELTSFPNLYWEIMNEQGWKRIEANGPEWTAHWLAFLDKHDPNRHLRAINAADVYDAMPGLDIVCEHVIPFFAKQLTTPELVVEIVHSNLRFGKPLVCDETGWFPPPSSTEDRIWRRCTEEQLANERRAFWYAFVAGGHWTATCWQDFEERDTHRWIRHLADFVASVPYWLMEPHDELLEGAHCLAQPGRQYVIYLGSGGNVSLDLGGRSPSDFAMHWLDPRSGEWSEATVGEKDSRVHFTAPSQDDWVLYIRARPEEL